MPRISSRKRVKIPATMGPTMEERTQVAYERLGVSESEVNLVPRITHILKHLPYGIDQAIEFLRGSSEKDAVKFLSVYDSLPVTTRELLPIEAFCVASGLGTKRVLELITGACFEQSATTTELIVRAAHPDIVKASASYAMMPTGDKDRKLIFQHTNFTPMPKTQVVNVHGDVNANDNRIQSISIGALSGIEGKMARIANRFNEKLGIGDGSDGNGMSVIEAGEIPEEIPEKVEQVEDQPEWSMD